METQEIPKSVKIAVVIGVVIVALVCGAGFTMKAIFSHPENMASKLIAGYNTYKSEELGISFDYPAEYRVMEDEYGSLILRKPTSTASELVLPQFIIGRQVEYEEPKAFLERAVELATEIYETIEMPHEIGSTYVGETEVFGIPMGYYMTNGSASLAIIDNHYAFLLDGKVYSLVSLEENENTEDVNEIAVNIIATMRAL